ncbi:hypothetical protein [Phaeodactylibacter sp.]|jgi:hypothetical protein|uniref:hypothetical protein n=1 Tax=Phaeodactylibacter sp. TaxID=1940289 RepID=UPI0025DFA24D|nr:hypothetical protein [Phaeodactylibacter sp.]MCI4647230.1 hypothetical protein [Phaeodactylibacter sp.]MCI5093955.1 hypothetical protein [Phaeodactylibacter sp.]
MKKSIPLLSFLLIAAVSVFAQNESSTFQKEDAGGFTYGEFKAGYGVTQFFSGLEDRFEAGNFDPSGGGLYSIAVYRKFNSINHLHFGLKFKALGAAPSQGDNDEELFFNFWGAAISTKYFPGSESGTKGFYLQGDYNFVSQFTQKYRNTENLDFDHQFAIGGSLTGGMGYQFPLKNRYGLVVSVEYDWAFRQGEVQDVGDVDFRNGNIGFQVGLTF